MSSQLILGPIHMIVLRAVGDGADRRAKLVEVLKAHACGDTLDGMLRRMREDLGLLRIKRGGSIALTAKGEALLPSRAGLPPITAYRSPVRPPRRAGSVDALAMPSLYAGRPVAPCR